MKTLDHAEAIQTVCQEAIRILQIGAEAVYAKEIGCTFHCGELPHTDQIRVHPDFQTLFQKWATHRGPALYWFEILDDRPGEVLLDALRAYNQKEGRKTTPAIRRQPDLSTRILYLGKVKKNLANRMEQHLGYYGTARTQGLQLQYWARPLGVRLRLWIYPFPDALAEYLSIIEAGMARRMKPLVGRHGG